MHFPSKYWAGNKEPIFQYLEADIFNTFVFHDIFVTIQRSELGKGCHRIVIDQSKSINQSINILYFTTGNSSVIQNDFVILALLRTINLQCLHLH